jgi:hypothetical protein
MKAICSSEMSVETQRTTQRPIPEDDTRQYKMKSSQAISHVNVVLVSIVSGIVSVFIIRG